jgi:hypothetical protein
MGWTFTIAAAVGLVVLLFVAGRLHAKRGIGRLSFLPWDYVMIVAAVLLLAVAGHGAILWRDGWPLPWDTPASGL